MLIWERELKDFCREQKRSLKGLWLVGWLRVENRAGAWTQSFQEKPFS